MTERSVMIIESELQARQAYVWASDYNNQNVAALLGRQGVSTFGDVADLSAEILIKIGLIQDEIYGVTQMLAKRGLILTKEQGDHDNRD